MVYWMVSHASFPSSAAGTSHQLRWPFYFFKACNAVSWCTMKHSTSHLYFLGIQSCISEKIQVTRGTSHVLKCLHVTSSNFQTKTKEPQKVLSSSGIRRTKFISVYDFPAQLRPSFGNQRILNFGISVRDIKLRSRLSKKVHLSRDF